MVLCRCLFVNLLLITFLFFRFTSIAHHVSFTLGKAEWKEIVNLAGKYLTLMSVPRTVIISYIYQ